jgi:hypothetical protein
VVNGRRFLPASEGAVSRRISTCLEDAGFSFPRCRLFSHLTRIHLPIATWSFQSPGLRLHLALVCCYNGGSGHLQQIWHMPCDN